MIFLIDDTYFLLSLFFVCSKSGTLLLPFPVTTLFREKVNPKSPQAFRIYKFKKYISAEYAQSEAEGISNH